MNAHTPRARRLFATPQSGPDRLAGLAMDGANMLKAGTFNELPEHTRVYLAHLFCQMAQMAEDWQGERGDAAAARRAP